jgi:HAD superfamily phosphoserine phosphatase-like hydrolase
MKELAVFDLDGTLIADDSFRWLVRKSLFGRPALVALGGARRLGVLSRAGFAERAHRQLRTLLQEPARLSEIVETLAQSVLPDRIRHLQEWRTRGASTVLLSSSPHDYVAPLGRRLGFDRAIGSDWHHGLYRHLHGDAKRAFIEQEFPADLWRRAFAMADAPSDEAHLVLFEQAVRVGAGVTGVH